MTFFYMYIGMSIIKIKSLNRPLEKDLHVSTSLLVPEEHLAFLKKITNKIGIPKFLNILIGKFEPGILKKEIEMNKRVTVKHQREGLNLQKISVEPLASDWVELGVLALALGVSKCYLFTLLVRLYKKWESGRYIKSFWKKFGIDLPSKEREGFRDYSIFTLIGIFLDDIYRRELHYGT